MSRVWIYLSFLDGSILSVDFNVVKVGIMNLASLGPLSDDLYDDCYLL